MGLGLAILLAGPAWATQPGKCTLLTESTGSEVLSDQPARLCLVEFTATAANGWAQVYDAGAVTQTAANLAEPSANLAYDHAVVDFGEVGHITDQGLGVYVVNGRVRIRWGR